MFEKSSSKVDSEVFIREAKRIVEEAAGRGLVLRVLGGVGTRLHSLERVELVNRLGSRLETSGVDFTDIDLMAYRKQRESIRHFLESLGYGKRRTTLSTAVSQRQIYFHPKGWFHIDVFFDRLLVANHPLDFRGRLELEFPTVALTDLLLEKLQIVSFSEKDLKDTLLILAPHELAESDSRESINVAYITHLLSRDWGFWYTVSRNLRAIGEILPSVEQLTSEERSNLASKVEALSTRVNREPKGAKWKLRALIGTRKRWYRPVETEETVGDFGIWRLREET